MVLVLSVIKLLVARAEGNGLISIPSALQGFVQGITGFPCAGGFCLLLASWAVPRSWQRQPSEFPSARAMANALPEQNLRADFGGKLCDIA